MELFSGSEISERIVINSTTACAQFQGLGDQSTILLFHVRKEHWEAVELEGKSLR